MVLRHWLKRFKSGDPVCKVADTRNMNRIANILEDLEVVGSNGVSANITKPTDGEGRGWVINVDGSQMLGSLPEQGLPSTGGDSPYALLQLSGYGATADQTEWKYGDTNAQGKIYVPLLVYQYRLYWSAAGHQLLFFHRNLYFNQDGMCCKITKEIGPEAVFTTVPENF